MKFQPIVPMIWTNEIEQTLSFYTEVLGFACGDRNEEWGWASLYRGECEMMIAKPNAHTPFERPTFTGSFYIKTDEVEVLWDLLKDKAKVCYALDDFDWGMREFAVYDNNGYILQFGQDITN